MFSHVYLPSPPLKKMVSFFWHVEMDFKGHVHREFPTRIFQGMAFSFSKIVEEQTWANTKVELSSHGYLFGQAQQYREGSMQLSGVSELVGVAFTPTGLRKLTGMHMLGMTDNFVHANEIWAKEADLLIEQMYHQPNPASKIKVLEAFLKQKMSKHLRNAEENRIDLVKHGVDFIRKHNGISSLQEIADSLFVTPKTLERAFNENIGIGPKLFADVQRFEYAQKLLQVNNLPDLTQVALNCGYYDNSHMVRHFKKFAGKSPKNFIGNATPTF